jgi:hypothetical protein
MSRRFGPHRPYRLRHRRLVILLNVGMTPAWSEPVSTLEGRLDQREASQGLSV